MNDMDLKPGVILNPAGGCDSTPFIRAGIRTVTLCAQNPTTTDYYHTYNDTVENLDKSVLDDSFEMIVNVVNATAEFDAEKNEKSASV